MRLVLYHFKQGQTFSEQQSPWPHTDHCMDTIRQSMMCNVDSSLMFTEDGTRYGDGQLHQCRDWDGLISWAQHHRPEQPPVS